MINSRLERYRPHLMPLLLLTAITFAVYCRILRHGFQANWDDNWYVLYNEAAWGLSWEHVKAAFTSYYLGNYAPVQILSYMLDYDLWGLRAGGFLFTNIIIHTASGLLIYWLIMRWYGNRLAALFASALFLLHPLQVESVAWISQRKTLLSMFFFLLAWEAYCRYQEAAPGKGRLAYALSVTAFVLSLLSKSMTVVFPAVLVLYDLCFPGGGRRLRLKDKAPFLLAAVVVALLAAHSEQPQFGGGRTGFHGGSPLATFLTMLPVLCRYLGMLVWPVGLSAEYTPLIHRSIDMTVIGAALFLAGVALAGALLFRKDRRAGFWVIFFWVGLLPVSQIVPMLSMINDRYLYMSFMGAAALAGSGAVALRERVRTLPSNLFYALLALPLLALSAASFQRAGVWRDGMTLWSDAAKKAPTSSRVWYFLGAEYYNSGKVEAARKAYERGLELNPSNTEILSGLGDLYTELGELDKGYALLEKLLRIKPYYAMGWGGLGNNYLKQGKYEEAEKAYKQSLAIQPDAMQVVALLGNLALIRGRLDDARDYYSKVEAKEWNDPWVAYRLACVESRAGRQDAALAWVATALRRGFNDYNALYDGADLTALRGDPRFSNLLLQYAQGERGCSR